MKLSKKILSCFLIHFRPNAKSIYKFDVTVDDSNNCLILAPDGFTGGLKDSYTLNEVNNLGLVCLPNAGSRYYSTISGEWGRYWTSTSSTAVMGNKSAWELYFKKGHVDTAPHDREKGLSIRLVRVAKSDKQPIDYR